MAHNLAVISRSSELEREREDKYNTVIYSSIPKKITVVWHASRFSSNTMIRLSTGWGGWTACNILTHFHFRDSVRSWKTTPIHRAALVISPPTSGVFSPLIPTPDLWEQRHTCPAWAEQRGQEPRTGVKIYWEKPIRALLLQLQILTSSKTTCSNSYF